MANEKPTVLRLIPIDRDLERTLSRGASEFEVAHAVLLGNGYELVQGVVQSVLGMHSESVAPWGGYLAVDDDTTRVVGTCAFKAPPDPAGRTEIAYFTFPEFEGRGYATIMARELIRLAEGSHAVQVVIAHTLPERNASTRILEKVGMTNVGEVNDPEDGLVWAWQIDLQARTRGE